jgi:hypothetical protein
MSSIFAFSTPGETKAFLMAGTWLEIPSSITCCTEGAVPSCAYSITCSINDEIKGNSASYSEKNSCPESSLSDDHKGRVSQLNFVTKDKMSGKGAILNLIIAIDMQTPSPPRSLSRQS